MGLRVQGLHKGFQVFSSPGRRFWARLRGVEGKGKRIQALEDISFEVPRGSTLGVAGRNGSGKSTLLRILSGAMSPERGTVEGPLRRASLLELGGAFSREESGRRNVQLAWILRGMDAKERAKRMEELEAFSGLGAHLDMPVKHYSGGQFLRLAFSEAVLWEPDLLLLDEVLAVGDAGFQARCLKKVEALKANGAILVLATHENAILASDCEQALWLDGGRLRLAGSGAEVAKAYAESFR
jgi:ABC-type polysaccharide/polyol phosphate transport system ATPase subunit